MKIIINNVEVTYHYISNDIVFIDLFFVPVHLQGNKLGSKVVKLFINQLPLEVTEVRCMASKNTNGRVSEFWIKQSFSYLYDVKYECFEEEILYSMTIGINGGSTKKFIYSETFENESDYF
jgi:hypothetical protein